MPHYLKIGINYSLVNLLNCACTIAYLSIYKPPWAHSDFCTLQLSPLYHHDEGIEEGSRNKYLCMV